MRRLTAVIIMHFLKEPFYNELRTKQQLGYVVFSRATESRDVLGCQFLVESPNHSCEYLYHAINQFMIEMRNQVKNLAVEDFELHRDAVKR